MVFKILIFVMYKLSGGAFTHLTPFPSVPKKLGIFIMLLLFHKNIIKLVL